RVKAQAFERNGEEHDVTIFGDPAFRLPDGIKAEIVFIDAFRSDAVQLYAKGIGEKFIGALAVVKRIQRDADSVVIGNVFPPSHVSAQRARISLADKGNIKVVIVIREKRGGGLAGRRSVTRLALAEISDL